MSGMMRTHRPVAARGRAGHAGGMGGQMGMTPPMALQKTRKMPRPSSAVNTAVPRQMKVSTAALLKKLM